MPLVNNMWWRCLSIVLFLLFAGPVNALPKKAKVSALTSPTAATSSSGVSNATDGSTILKNTVTIK